VAAAAGQRGAPSRGAHGRSALARAVGAAHRRAAASRALCSHAALLALSSHVFHLLCGRPVSFGCSLEQYTTEVAGPDGPVTSDQINSESINCPVERLSPGAKRTTAWVLSTNEYLLCLQLSHSSLYKSWGTFDSAKNHKTPQAPVRNRQNEKSRKRQSWYRLG